MPRTLAALAESATDPWVLALFALALFAWLETEIRGVVAAFLPLACALAVAAALGALAGALGAGPRPGDDPATLARWALPAANTVAAGAFAAYSLLAYGRRGWGAPAAMLAAAGIQVFGQGGTWAAAAGGAAGALLGTAAWLGAVLVLPGGRLARSRRTRRTARDGLSSA